jgi:sterol 3beta-glucosyltransferase
MKILLLSIGTRGDMEPFLATGDWLLTQGHELGIVMPEQFRELAGEVGLEFFPLSRQFLELLETSAGRGIMGQRGGKLRRFGQLLSLARQSMQVQKTLLVQQKEAIDAFRPDQIFYHPKCLFGRLWGMLYPDRAAVLSPIPNWLHPVREYPHIAFPQQWGQKVNRWTYSFTNGMTALMGARMLKPFRQDYPAINLSRRAILQHMREQERVLYLVSQILFPQPDYWPKQARVVGYLERPKTNNWQPPEELLTFLADHHHEQVLFFTFGSMVNADPARTTEIILEVLQDVGVPAILNVAAGGLVLPTTPPDRTFWVEDIPYDWIFPKVYGVIHHGGSGTTHTTLKHGCASLIIPHIIDQFFWNQRCADIGVGPLGPPIKRLSKTNLTSLLGEMLRDTSYRERAELLGQKMKDEGFESEQLLRGMGKTNRNTVA